MEAFSEATDLEKKIIRQVFGWHAFEILHILTLSSHLLRLNTTLVTTTYPRTNGCWKSWRNVMKVGQAREFFSSTTPRVVNNTRANDANFSFRLVRHGNDDDVQETEQLNSRSLSCFDGSRQILQRSSAGK